MSDQPTRDTSDRATSSKTKPSTGLLDAVEWIGNKLPDPVLLFLGGAVLVMVLSHLVSVSGWAVQPQAAETAIDPATGEASVVFVPEGDPIQASSLLTADGLYWCTSSMVENFMAFPPLGVVLVGMLGIGVAERCGFLAAILKAFMAVVPRSMLTPTMVFLGIMSSMGIDAGYVVLPPLAAALYKSVGRSPLAGLAAVFAGVSAGFNANLFVTGLDPLLAGFSQLGAQVIDPAYRVSASCNWWFMIASTFVITGVGWLTTATIVERRLSKKSAEDGGPGELDDAELKAQRITPTERKGLLIAALTMVGLILVMVASTLVPGTPLFDRTMPSPTGEGRVLANVVGIADSVADTAEPALVVAGEGAFASEERDRFITISGEVLEVRSPPFARWVDVVTPLIFLAFVVPGVVYGVVTGSIRSSKDAAKLMVDSMAGMAPIIVLAFFAAQFIEYLQYSQLDKMLAYTGGQFLATAGLGPIVLVLAFIALTMVFNLFVGSMSAKYAIFAPIFVPMLMFAGVSPELTQAAYRIGDSTTNIITPLNAYLVIILVFMQRHAPKAGMGTLISMMMPYTVAFTIAWAIMLAVWMQLGIPLGVPGPLEYPPPAN
ncbi:MAG: AbgT family transporter [Planctomycetota bacterium]